MTSIRNDRGQSLVQVLVAAGVMAIVMASMASMMTNQAKQAAAMAQKLAILDLQQLIQSIYADGKVCESLMTSLGGIPFNGNSPPAEISLGNTLPASVTAGIAPLATVGQVASPISPSLVVSSLKLNNISSIGGGNFLANLQVDFDPTKMMKSMRPAAVSVVLRTTGAGTVTVVGCKPGSAAGGSEVGDTCDTGPMGWGAQQGGLVMRSWGGNQKYCCMLDRAVNAWGEKQNSGNGGTTALFTCYNL